ncbi:protein GVQW3-like [Octopus sinensis]|uniref:Protein GVQW3-like n=1 Tax=Octopus sinensis TaxID=2607531 RepID=A0A6P7T0K9_9MOLL|nr:protein GVQW3-like [Octopus sinensis]
MPLELEQNLEACHAIKFCVNRLTSMNRSSAFRWHKRVKVGKEEVKDDDEYGKERDVRTSELINKICKLLDEDRCVSIKTAYKQFRIDVSTFHGIIYEGLNMGTQRPVEGKTR